MLAKAVLFRPSYVLLAHPSVDLGGVLDASAVHALVTPLVARLNRPQHLHASAKDAAKATAALERVASGLAVNPSVDPRELLLYVYSTCAPFVKSRFGGRRTAVRSVPVDDATNPEGGDNAGSSDDEDSSASEDEEEGNDDEDEEEKLEWTAKRMNIAPKTPKSASKSDLATGGAAAAAATPSLSKSARKRQSEARRAQRQLSGTTWLPSMNAGDRLREGGGGVKSMVGYTAAQALSGALPPNAPKHASSHSVSVSGGRGGAAAVAAAGLRSPVSKKARKYASVQVLDGAQAPKLTGRDRLTSHHRPGEVPGQEGGAQVKGMVENDEDEDENGEGGGNGGSNGNGISQLNEAAAHGTVHFALSVFYSHLRKGCLSPHALGVGDSGSGGGGGSGGGFGFAKTSPEVLRDVLAMAEPFLPLLNHCARAAVSDDRVRLLALKCLGLLLKWPLSGISKYARRLGKGLLKLLTWASGGGGNGDSGSSSAGVVASRSELVQGCFKGLTTLLYFDPTEAYAAGGGALGMTKGEGDSSANFAVTADLAAAAAASHHQQQQLALTDGSNDSTAAVQSQEQQQYRGPKVALSAAEMKALVRVLHHSLLDASHQTSSFQLVRALVHQRVVVSEMCVLVPALFRFQMFFFFGVYFCCFCGYLSAFP